MVNEVSVNEGSISPSSEERVFKVASISGKSPELYSAKVIRETPKQVQVERQGWAGDVAFAFSFKTRFAPAEVHRTPEAAWRAYYQELDAQVHELSEELQCKAALWSFAADAIAVRLWETLK